MELVTIFVLGIVTWIAWKVFCFYCRILLFGVNVVLFLFGTVAIAGILLHMGIL